MPFQLVVVSTLQDSLYVPLCACNSLMVGHRQLLIIVPRCLDADLGEFDPHWLAHQVQTRLEALVLVRAIRMLRRSLQS